MDKTEIKSIADYLKDLEGLAVCDYRGPSTLRYLYQWQKDVE